VEAVEAEEH